MSNPIRGFSIHRLLTLAYSLRYPLFLLGLAAIPFHNFQSNGLVLWDDLALPPYAANQFAKSLLVWHSGTSDISNLNYIPLYGFMALLERVPIPLSLLQQLYFLGIYWLMGLSMFALSKALFPSKSGLGHIAAAALYMFNPLLAAYDLVGGTRTWMIAYAIAPIMLVFLARGLARPKSREWVVVGLLMGCISFSANLWGLNVILGLATLFTVLDGLLKRSLQSLLAGLVFLAKSLTVFALLAAFWLAPGAVYLSTIFSNTTRITGSQFNPLTFMRNVGPGLVNVFRLYSPANDYGFQAYYASSVAVLLGLGISCAALAGLLVYSNRRSIMIVSILFLVYCGLAAIGSSTLSTSYAALIDLIPFGRAIIPSDPNWYLLYAVPICLCPLLANTINEISVKFYPARHAVVGVALLVLLANSWPIATGYQPPYSMNGQQLSFNQPTNIPTYYSQLQDFMAHQGDNFNVFLVPSPTVLFYSKYAWLPNLTGWQGVNNNQGIQELSGTLLLQNEGVDVYYVQPYSPSPQSLLQTIEHAMYQNLTQHLGRLLELIGARFLVLRTDLQNPIQWTNHGATQVNMTTVEKNLEGQKDLTMVRDFGRIKVFANDEVTSETYTPNRIVSVIGNTDSLIPLSNAISFKGTAFTLSVDYPSQVWRSLVVNSSALVVPAAPTPDQTYISGYRGPVVPISNLAELNSSLPAPSADLLTFFSNPVSWQSVVNAKDANRPFVYVVNQAFDSGWSVRCGVDQAYHFLINSFANGYYVQCKGNGMIIAAYSPYQTFLFAAYVSLVSAIVIPGALLTLRSSRVRGTSSTK